MEEGNPTAWADDGTAWDTPGLVLSDGPQSVVLDAEDRALVAVLPASGRVGFTVEPGPSNPDTQPDR